MKKIGLLVALVLAFQMVPTQINLYASNESIDYTKVADDLKELGLFQGSNKGYELDRAATRIEGIIMLIRLIGQEETVLSYEGSHPFIDVPKWADKYVAYAYNNKLTNGVSDTEFGSSISMTGAQFATFTLRSLGYDDKIGDFKWDTAIEKAGELNILSQEEIVLYTSSGFEFLRGDCVNLSYKALSSSMKTNTDTLSEFLVEQGSISKDKALAIGIITENIDEVIDTTKIYTPLEKIFEFPKITNGYTITIVPTDFDDRLDNITVQIDLSEHPEAFKVKVFRRDWLDTDTAKWSNVIEDVTNVYTGLLYGQLVDGIYSTNTDRYDDMVYILFDSSNNILGYFLKKL